MSDLQAYEVYLQNHNGPLPLSVVRGDWLRGLFYAGFRKLGVQGSSAESFEENAAATHEKGQKGREGETAPYAISVLSAEIEAKGKRVEVLKGIRIATFKAEIGDRVAEIWGGRAAKRAEVELGNATLTVEGIKPDRQNGISFDELKEQAVAAYGVAIELRSPTLFERGDHLDLLPAPRTIWAGYRRRWEQYAPSELCLPEPEQNLFDVWVEQCVHTRRLSTHTNPMLVREKQELNGLTGQLEFHALIEDENFPESRLDEYLQTWQMLAMFAEFCGTGRFTTEGFGHTRFLRSFGSRK